MSKTLPILMTLIIFLAACGGATTESANKPGSETAAITNGNSTRLSADYKDALPVSTQLIIGSLQLDDTDKAISEAQADELLPLWQAYQSLGNSETTAETGADGSRQPDSGYDAARTDADDCGYETYRRQRPKADAGARHWFRSWVGRQE